MEDKLVVCFFMDLIIQLALLFQVWRLIRCIRQAQGKTKTSKPIKYVNQKLLLFFQIAFIIVIFLLAYSLTYGSGEASFGSLLMMFALYLAMPMHSAVLILTIALNSLYKKIVQQR